ncbi:MAG: DUF4012 domain-containing protein [Candidatus Komeilibacteria bacterium]
MKKSSQLNNKNQSPVDFDLADFYIAEEELVEEIAIKAKAKLLTQYELDKLINQSTQQTAWPIRKNNSQLLPTSPHILDLRRRLQVQEQELAALEKDLVRQQNVISWRQRWLSLVHWQWQWPEFSWRPALWQKLSAVQFLISCGLLLFMILKNLGRLLRFSLRRVVDFILHVWLGFQKIKRHIREGLTNVQEASWRRGLRPAAMFAVIATLLLLPYAVFGIYRDARITEGKVMGISRTAIDGWQLGVDALVQGDWQAAWQAFDRAGTDFSDATSLINNYQSVLLNMSQNMPGALGRAASGQRLLSLGEKLSATVADISSTIQSSQDSEMVLTDKLSLWSEHLSQWRDVYNDIGPDLLAIQVDLLPMQYQAPLLYWQKNYHLIENLLNESQLTLDWLKVTLGANQPQRYLIMFQNSNELRATGGFMGSFALLDVAQGEISNIEIPGGGIYALQGQQKEFVAAPYPMQLLSSRWQWWDANWWPDWPTSAQKIAWFYERAGGATVDGVIAINSQVLSDWMNLVGPISLPKYDKELDSANVILALQHAVEFEYDKQANRPKSIIGDLFPVLMQRIYDLPADKYATALGLVLDEFNRSDIQFYFTNDEQQNYVANHRWDGSIKKINGDYLNVVATNIGGGKTDAVIKQKVDYQISLGPDDHLIAKVAITRSHHGDQEDVFERQRNVSFLRLYVPLGSDLIQVNGAMPPDDKLFESVGNDLAADKNLIAFDGLHYYAPFEKYYSVEQFGKQVFGQWLMVDPGESKTITFIYRLPIAVEQVTNKTGWLPWSHSTAQRLVYSLYVQKQSGDLNTEFNFATNLDDSWQIEWAKDSDGNLVKLGNWLSSSQPLQRDYQLGFIITK